MTNLFVLLLTVCFISLNNSSVLLNDINYIYNDNIKTLYKESGSIKLIDNNAVIASSKWTEITENGCGTYKVKNHLGYYGVIDSKGTLVIEDVWDKIYLCSDDRVFCEGYPEWGDVALFDLNGNLISSGYIGVFISDYSYQYVDGIAAVHDANGDFFIDIYGNQISETYAFATGFSSGYAIVQDNEDSDCYIIDASFNIIELPRNTVLYSTEHLNSNFIIEDQSQNTIYILNLKSLVSYGPFSEIINVFNDCIYLNAVDNSNITYYCFSMIETTINETTADECGIAFD